MDYTANDHMSGNRGDGRRGGKNKRVLFNQNTRIGGIEDED